MESREITSTHDSSTADERTVGTAIEGLLDLSSYDEAMDHRRLAENTKRAYDSDWTHFADWCDLHGMPHEAVRPTEQLILSYLHYWGDPEFEQLRAEFGDRRLKWSTLQRRLASIRGFHSRNGLDFPSYPDRSRNRLQIALQVIKKAQADPQDKARAISERLIVQMATACDDSPIGIRDRALLLTGYLGGLRRSEITGLDFPGDVLFIPDQGIKLLLRAAKTDREREGQAVYIPYTRHANTCAVRSVNWWLDLRGSRPGPLFPSMWKGGVIRGTRPDPVLVDRLVKKYVAKVGEDPESYSAHSLRSGFATSAALANAPIAAVKRHTRHSSLAALDGYIQEGRAFEDNPIHALKHL